MNSCKDTNKKYTLYIRTGSELKELGKFSNRTELDTLIYSYLNSIGFHSYYSRYLAPTTDGTVVIDYGSHTSFFVILTIEEIDNVLCLFCY